MINESEDFIDGKLGGFEIVLERLLKTAHSGRERLSAQGLPSSMLNPEPRVDDFCRRRPPFARVRVRRRRGVLLRSGLLLEQWRRRISFPSRRCYVTCPRRCR